MYRLTRALLPCILGLVSTQIPASDIAPVREKELETLLYQDCGSCHGMTLKGGLGPALSQERMNRYTREGLAGLILQGIPGTAMPSWGALLSEKEARWIADQLQHNNPLER
ncbi:cytochrome c [Halovibrio sp. HP20-50]|uniref:c-type cytochrome n=1 Tax=Halovibrio sp. HP20-59 TaxID=3080275 RepID=UPI00294B1B04|nr:cytochrome c [Halovibrio sp. HP20-59]MEA2118528.1 cytochrome c [Halovibrio sp. HP20-59]